MTAIYPDKSNRDLFVQATREYKKGFTYKQKPKTWNVVELLKRLAELLPNQSPDWKMQGPGRVFFTRPDSLLASLFWDAYLSVSCFAVSFLQFGNDPDGLMHTWYVHHHTP